MKKTILILSAVVLLCAMIFCQSAFAADTEDYPHIDADCEDSDISLWFDYSTEKIKQSDTTSTGMNGFTIYMAKNEMEDAQFVLLSSADKSGLTAEITDFEDDDGNVVPSEVYIELYSDCANYGYVPDATPPLSAYGEFSLSAGSTQAFLIRAKTSEDTVAGDYEATLSVYDEDENEIKTAKVYVHVWDFALSEKTECATSINLSRGGTDGQAALMGISSDQMYKNYYDYLLENRICSYYLPYDIYNASAVDYMDNPRVTSFQMTDKYGTLLGTPQLKVVFKKYFSGEEGQQRFEKSYVFSGIVDAYRPDQLEAFRNYYNNLRSTYSELALDYTDVPFNLINTYINDIDYQTDDGMIDQVEYYSDFLRFWCSKPFAYTDKDELSVFGAKLMQPQKWDDVYGTFGERMAAKRADGQKVWWFLSWDVDPPYINYYIQTDGVAQRVLFWQQYDNGVQGFLTNFSNYWIGDPYVNTITDQSKPNAHGESAFIYPGANFGLSVPVGSLRLEAMRDGIEDYQMFYMLEELEGEGSADAIIDEMTTGMVHYSTSDADYYETRKLLGNSIEIAIAAQNCEHEFNLLSETAASCTEEGVKVFKCDKCGYTYADRIAATGHNYVRGICTECGAQDPDYSAVMPGDVTGDGKVSSQDVNMMSKILTGLVNPSENQTAAADLDGSNKIDAKDALLLERLLTGVS